MLGGNTARLQLAGRALTADVTYTVGETQVQGYLQMGAAVCVHNDTRRVGHSVTLEPGQSVTCTITNDDIEEVEPIDVLPFTGVYGSPNGLDR